MKKIILFGAAGLLGEAVARIGQNCGYQIELVTRREIDLKDIELLGDYLESSEADVYVYTAGLTSLEACLDQPDLAHKINVAAPSLIAQHASSRNVGFVYISTDYVFDGYLDAYPDELSMAQPINVYGKSKVAGENECIASCPEALILRVSWLFGRGRKSFVDSVIDSIQKGEQREYISDKWSVPNWCDDLARLLYQLLESGATGVIHAVSSGEPVSWYAYAVEIEKIAQRLGVTDSHEGLVNKSKMEDVEAFREKRPVYTAMCSRRLEQKFLISMPDWRQSLEQYIRIQYVPSS